MIRDLFLENEILFIFKSKKHRQIIFRDCYLACLDPKAKNRKIPAMSISIKSIKSMPQQKSGIRKLNGSLHAVFMSIKVN